MPRKKDVYQFSFDFYPRQLLQPIPSFATPYSVRALVGQHSFDSTRRTWFRADSAPGRDDLSFLATRETRDSVRDPTYTARQRASSGQHQLQDTVTTIEARYFQFPQAEFGPGTGFLTFKDDQRIYQTVTNTGNRTSPLGETIV
jgi:hypothetical protein